jgi:NTP pyrophosphatase (non-canonical NTP hydrolase)
MPLNNSPKKRAGRPRKHSSAAAAIEAKKQSDRRRYLRGLQARGPADFIAYEPPRADTPADTPPTGLRTSPDIRIPLDDNTQPDGVLENTRLASPPTQPLVSDEEVQVTAQLEQIQIEEQELNRERDEHEAEISQKLDAMDAAAVGILVEMQSASINNRVEEARSSETGDVLQDNLVTAGFQAINGSDTIGEVERIRDDEPLISCFSTVASVDEPCATPSKPESVQRSRESTASSPALAQHSSPSLQSSGSKRGSRRSTSFPLQKNNLMSWVQALPPQRPTDTPNATPPLSTARPPSSDNVSAPTCPVEGFRASSLVRGDISPTPGPATPSVPDAVVPVGPSGTPIPLAGQPGNREAPPVPTERTAFKLARQLRDFQGCTHEQHRAADQLHQEHHRRPDVHSQCFSLQQITRTLRGDDRDTPLPDVLRSPKLMKAADVNGLDFRAAFEGTNAPGSLGDTNLPDNHLPKNLYLSQCHSASNKNRHPKITFDIDSTCCFIQSLAAARLGIEFLPKNHAILTLDSDVHFGLRAPVYNSRGALTTKYTPLHKLPNYCMGNVVGMTPLFIYIFFPTLHIESDYEHSNYLSNQDHELLYDGVIGPAMNKVIGSSNIM